MIAPQNEIGTEHIISLWTDYGLSKISLPQLIESIRKVRRLKEVSIDINYECNFSCSYCSYGFRKLHGKELSIDEWKPIINECIDKGARLFAIAGKEPLINERFKEILLHLKRMREEQNIELITGLVTNGWFLKEKVEHLIGTGLSYLDVSIDGHMEIHDANRRKGSYERAIEGLLAAQEKGAAGRLFISSVLHAQNYRDIPYLIRDLYHKGIKNFNISLLYPTPDVPPHLLFSKDEIATFLKDLLPGTISTIENGSDLQIVVDMFTASLPFLREMVVEKIIDIDEVNVDDIDSLFSYDVLTNGSIIYRRYSIDHLTYGKAIKITADGYCMTDYASLTKPDYWKYSTGNLRDESITSLYNKLFSEGSYIFEVARHADKSICPEEPCYPLCLGNNKECSYIRNKTSI